MKWPLIIYHGGCNDGFVAALIADQHYNGRCDLYPATDRKGPPADLDLKGRVVLILDYSYPEPVLREIAKQAHVTVVIDHHKTAEEDLAAIPRLADGAPLASILQNRKVPRAELDTTPRPGKLYALFDMEMSGARLAWRFFNDGKPVPRIVEYVQDRDMWWHHLPRTEQINAALASYPHDPAIWRHLWDMAETHAGLNELTLEGRGILRMHKRAIEAIMKTCVRTMMIGDRAIPVANANYHYASDLGGLLAAESEHGYAAVYSDTREGRMFSLRSRGPDAPDVSVIAKRHGGGGHRNAAGFLAPHGWTGEYDA